MAGPGGARGIQFRTGLAASPLTAPSHASILSGTDPPRHGVRDNGTFPLPEDVPTLATGLKARGFATGGFVAAYPLIGRIGFARGFDVYDDAGEELTPAEAFGMAQRPGDQVADAAAAWIRAQPPDARFFAWVHFFDAHAPYEPPLPWKSAAGGRDYAGDVAWTDDHLGRVIRFLELERPDAWLLLQADHGESLGQHGEDTHAIFVYDATIRVPALLWPAPRGERPGLREGVFRNVDVPATAFELLGFLPDAAPGNGISPLSDVAGPAYSESLYPWFHYGWGELRAVREGRWTYIRAPESE
ncbi:MAG TPA: sulfatase-like hydrolase/transferase, partial [bacterium]|nr:sulfatase-like hydrolase/transferase [bacterium]